MRWKRGTGGGDVIDVRGRSRRGGGGFGGGGFGGGGFGGGGRRRGGMGGLPIPMGRRGGGAGLVVVLVIIAFQVLGGGGGGAGTGAGYPVAPGFEDPAGVPRGGALPASQDPDRDLRDFSAYVFDHAQDRWTEVFRDAGETYRRAKLVLYRDEVTTEGCGGATSAVGPFYCPADERVYLDLSFFRDMKRDLGAGGDFAWAYVIAHETGHHVQHLLGTSDEVRRVQRDRPDERNELSVRLELQADCYAGVWGHSVAAEGLLEEGDLEEAIGASEAVGDDRLQSRGSGTVDPDSFTHGTSEQRAAWYRRGQQQGDPSACDTFAAERL
jgi:hypothetical protein